jgi:DNA invertase Pin-like site-specific DNA recombinase
VYAPRQGNDRLLLGLKGSLNEYELDLLRQRSLSARYEKARRGELVVGAPIEIIMAQSVATATDVLHLHANVTQRLRAKARHHDRHASEREGAGAV